jgi:hypothetical protein
MNVPARLNANSVNYSGSILDLIFCNDNFVIQNVNVAAPFSSSDHSTIDFNLLCHISFSDHNVEYRNFNDADWDAIKLFLTMLSGMIFLMMTVLHQMHSIIPFLKLFNSL